MRERRAGTLLWVAAWSCLATSEALAQASPGSVPVAAFHIDVARYFFASDADVSAAARALNDRLAELDELRGASGDEGSTLLRMLELRDSAQIASDRLWAYYDLESALDTRDVASEREGNRLASYVEARTGWVGDRMSAIDDEHFARLVAREPGLGRYAPELRAPSIRAGQGPTDEQRTILATLEPLATEWQFPLWQRLGPEEREARAFTLLETARARDRMARIYGWRSFPEQVYTGRTLTVADVTALLVEVRRRSAPFRDFLGARARHAGRGAVEIPPVPVDSARAWMRAALTPLGDEYAAEVESLLDPANGRLELEGGEFRRAGGFSFVSPGRTTGVYLAQYSGSLRDVGRLVHEAGHAIHRRLMDVHSVPYPYRGGPLLMEPVALFGELLLWDHVRRAAASPAIRAQADELFLAKAFEVFYGARDAELEQAIYESLGDDALRSPDDLDALTARVDQAYTADGTGGDGTRWMRTDLMVEDPLYLSNYLYSGLIALAFYERFQEDSAGFGRRWVAFLSGGFAEAPADRLKMELGIDLHGGALLDSALELLKSRLLPYATDVPIGP